jgi:hypothetical protein
MLCEFCEKPINGMPYKCKYCSGIFCDEHRIPEAHKCSNIDNFGRPWFKDGTIEEEINDLEKENVGLKEILLGHIQSSTSRKEALDRFNKNEFKITKLNDKRKKY